MMAGQLVHTQLTDSSLSEILFESAEPVSILKEILQPLNRTCGDTRNHLCTCQQRGQSNYTQDGSFFPGKKEELLLVFTN